MPKWIRVSDHLPEPGENVILYFRDSRHKDPSWPRLVVMPAWLANIGEKESPDGAFAIEGRLGDSYSVVSLEDAIAWMPLPDLPDFE